MTCEHAKVTWCKWRCHVDYSEYKQAFVFVSLPLN